MVIPKQNWKLSLLQPIGSHHTWNNISRGSGSSAANVSLPLQCPALHCSLCSTHTVPSASHHCLSACTKVLFPLSQTLVGLSSQQARLTWSLTKVSGQSWHFLSYHSISQCFRLLLVARSLGSGTQCVGREQVISKLPVIVWHLHLPVAGKHKFLEESPCFSTNLLFSGSVTRSNILVIPILMCSIMFIYQSFVSSPLDVSWCLWMIKLYFSAIKTLRTYGSEVKSHLYHQVER